MKHSPKDIVRTLVLNPIVPCLLWSSAFAGLKIALQYSKPLGLAGIRFMIAGLLILPLCGPIVPMLREIRSHFRDVAVVAFFQTFVLYGLFTVGMTMVSGALGAVIIGAGPLYSALIAHFMMPGDRLTRPKVTGIVIGIAGVVFISLSRKPWNPAGFTEFTGVLILIASGISSALGNVFVSKSRPAIAALSLNFAQLFTGGLALFLLSLVVEGIPDLHQPLTFFAALAWLSFLPAAGFSIWFILLKRPGTKVSELNVWKFLIPACGAALAWLILPGESPNTVTLIGIVSVSIAIWIFHRRVSPL